MAIQTIKGKRGTKFKVVLSHAGKSIHVGTFGTTQEAEDAETEAKYLRKRVKGGTLAASALLKTGRTFDDLCDEYLQSLERNPKASAYDSRLLYGDRLRLVWRKRFGSKRLSEIQGAHIEEALSGLLQTLAGTTVHGYRITLSATLTFAVKRKWLDKNPCHGIDFNFVYEPEFDWLKSQAEVNAFLAAFDHETWRDIAAFAIGTGMRIGEYQALRWEDVSLDRRLITVCRTTKKRRLDMGKPKGGKSRVVPIMDDVLPILRRRKLASRFSQLVFPNPTNGNGAYFGRSSFENAKNRALKDAGIDRAIKTHDLRHTFASHWAKAGGNMWKLSKVLGHSSIAITEKTYAHLCPEAFEGEYGRVGFSMPSDELAQVITLPSRTKS